MVRIDNNQKQHFEYFVDDDDIRAHTAMINESGQVSVFGRTHGFKNTLRFMNMNRIVPWLVRGMNAWGRGHVEYEIPTTLKFDNDEVAVQVSASAALTMIRCASGSVYSFGANAYGQCGMGSEKALHVWKPTKVVDISNAVDVACGYQHVLAALENGEVVAFGKGERGQLGCGFENGSAPITIPIPKDAGRVVQVGAGFNHSVALTGNTKQRIVNNK